MGGEFDRVDRRVRLGLSGCDELPGGGDVVRILPLQRAASAVREDRQFLPARKSRSAEAKAESNAPGVVRTALFQHPFGEGARSFGVGDIVERDERACKGVFVRPTFTVQVCRLETSKNIVGPTMRRQNV